MEKLTGLLNEWSKTAIKNKCNWTDVYDEEGVYFVNLFDRDMTMEIEDVISKRNGFIKWLVDNEKIDFENRDLKDKYMEYFERYPYRPYTDFSLEGLIMLLSIQDEPIEFLISLLKNV